MNVGSLFSGAGLMDWGLTLAGFRHSWFCERDSYCRRVLRLRYPDALMFGEVAQLRGRGIPAVDVLAGGFPCQPFSSAGRKRGMADERWLWPEFARLVGELRPLYVLVENVPGLTARGGGMGRVLGDLAELGYDAEWDRVFAASFGAPHLRERIFILAYPDSERSSRSRLSTRERQQGLSDAAGSGGSGSRSGAQGDSGTSEDTHGSPVLTRWLRWGAPQTGSAGWWASEPDVGRVAHGVPDRLDRLAAIGNGVVPQIAQWIGERILEREAVA